MIRELLRRNPGLKLASLVIAYVLWAWAVGQGPAIRQFAVPLQVQPPSDDFLVIDVRPSEVRVRVEGDPTTVRGIEAGEVYARHPLHLTGARPDDGPRELRVHLRPQDIRQLPPGIHVTVLDEWVQVVLEPKLERAVPVKVAVEGDPATGYEVVRIVATPPRVRVTGPRSRVEALEQVVTDTVSIEGASVTRVFRGLPVAAPEGVSQEKLVFDPPRVDVRVEIDQVPEVFEFEVPVSPTTTGWTVEPGKVTVRLKATPNAADRVADQLRATVATGDLPEDGKVRRRPVQVSLGDLDPVTRSRVEIVDIDPPRVRVRHEQHP